MAVYAVSQHYGGSAGDSSWGNGSFDWGPAMRDSSGGYTWFPDYGYSSSQGFSGPGYFTGGYGSGLHAGADVGRIGVNVTSLQSFKHGLFVFDFDHLPENSCSMWATIALVSSVPTVNYANKMNLVNYWNNQTFNRFEVDSKTAACKPPGDPNSYTGVKPTDYIYQNCYNNDPKAVPAGCVYYSNPSDPGAVGRQFDTDQSRGWYVLEWTSNRIAMWHFPRNNAPFDILHASPNPANWPTPALLMNKNDGCDPDVAFPDPMKIQIMLRYCGSGAGSTYQADGCKNGNQDCPTFNALKETPNPYYGINQITVFQDPNDPQAMSEPTCSVPVQDPMFGSVSTPSVPLGCYNDLSNFSGFQKMSTASGMTAAQCFGICGNEAYSAVNGNDCYCSNSISKIS